MEIFNFTNKARKALTFFIVMMASFLMVTSNGFPAKQRNHVILENGLISIEVHDQKLDDLLNEIAEVLSIRVYLYDNSGSDNVTLSLYDYDPVRALRSVLRTRNYCIVFSDRQGLTGVERLYAWDKKSVNTSVSSRNSDDTYEVDPLDRTIGSLVSRIEDIQLQIENGEADRWYEKCVKINGGEKYVTHPKVTLVRLEEKLNNLLIQH